jgi:hypothetical protein
MAKVKVTLKNGKVIEVLPAEVSGLKKAGLLKESKIPNMTKEEKNVGETKDEKAAMEKMYPKKKRPVNISSKNINRGRR